jgi:hypothetical protein
MASIDEIAVLPPKEFFLQLLVHSHDPSYDEKLITMIDDSDLLAYFKFVRSLRPDPKMHSYADNGNSANIQHSISHIMRALEVLIKCGFNPFEPYYCSDSSHDVSVYIQMYPIEWICQFDIEGDGSNGSNGESQVTTLFCRTIKRSAIKEIMYVSDTKHTLLQTLIMSKAYNCAYHMVQYLKFAASMPWNFTKIWIMCYVHHQCDINPIAMATLVCQWHAYDSSKSAPNSMGSFIALLSSIPPRTEDGVLSKLARADDYHPMIAPMFSDLFILGGSINQPCIGGWELQDHALSCANYKVLRYLLELGYKPRGITHCTAVPSTEAIAASLNPNITGVTQSPAYIAHSMAASGHSDSKTLLVYKTIVNTPIMDPETDIITSNEKQHLGFDALMWCLVNAVKELAMSDDANNDPEYDSYPERSQDIVAGIASIIGLLKQFDAINQSYRTTNGWSYQDVCEGTALEGLI